MRGDTFEYTIPGYDTFVWDVHLAQVFIAQGAIERTVTMPLEVMADVVAKNEVDADWVDRVDPNQPGIGAPIIDPTQETPCIIYVLIDGTHRCARALRDNQPFTVHLLTDAAAKLVLIAAPAALVPFDWP